MGRFKLSWVFVFVIVLVWMMTDVMNDIGTVYETHEFTFVSAVQVILVIFFFMLIGVMAGREEERSKIVSVPDPVVTIAAEDRIDFSLLNRKGTFRIWKERNRQIDGEGFKPYMDDQYMDHELVRAAISYLIHYTYWEFLTAWATAEVWWPRAWDKAWFKPTSKLRSLEKAGALIAAEIDRLQRSEEQREEKGFAGHVWNGDPGDEKIS